ncbi:BglG family transcription antiterminator [Priestia endophytica]|uniref:BglG family transcription antiterminator n=1 Tax=Priestia endophytica TaxID=135735 RepID=UPI000DCA903E|nr:BglG family transcription antiterminator [Priestia endophytica]KAB2490025.1 BglG family transcription antiterminator [Priestia endophytica]MBG9812271.1 sugar transporter [Priestia endophytica]RAS76552.1 sugar transporter [Priestia endophytica]
MFITSREKEIIELIIKTSGKHTPFSIATFLNVSVRTVHRDLRAIERVLKNFDLTLERTSDNGLMIIGKNERVFKLVQALMHIEPVDQSPQQRKLILLLSLIRGEESLKLQVLSRELGVSTTTLSSYLDELAEWLKDFKVTLLRKRGVGVSLHGSEESKRKMLAAYLLIYFAEELIQDLFHTENLGNDKKEVLHYLKVPHLIKIKEAVNRTMQLSISKLADSDYIGLIVHICIAIQRTSDGFLLEEEYDNSIRFSHEYKLIEEICSDFIHNHQEALTEKDLCFLTIIFKGSKLQEGYYIYNDSIILSSLIKKMIEEVSDQLHVNLEDDFSLFQGLLAHMEPSLFRIQQKMALFNPLTEDIRRKYPVLFMAVRNSLEKHFKEVSFPDDEVAYLVLHFGSALVLREEAIALKALIVCPTGIGTSKMLASRVKKEVIEIQSVEISSLMEIQNRDLSQYDVIISTVRLPFTNLDYILVTPLLNDDDVSSIHQFLQNHIGDLTKNKSYATIHYDEANFSSRLKKPFRNVLKELEDVYRSMEAILNHFTVLHFKSPFSNHKEIIKKVVQQQEDKGLLSQKNEVVKKLEEREEKGGLGIPETGMALFHTKHSSIATLSFQIAHLEEACTVKGMDGKDMEVWNMLFMLAPENLSTRQQEILSLISTTLIEDKEAMMIFSSSNENIIRQKLEETFYEYLQNNLIKE